MTRPRRSARSALHRLLEEVKQQSQTTVPKRVVGRRSDGLEQHLRLDWISPSSHPREVSKNRVVIVGEQFP